MLPNDRSSHDVRLERRESPLLQSAAEEVSRPLQAVIPRGFVPWRGSAGSRGSDLKTYTPPRQVTVPTTRSHKDRAVLPNHRSSHDVRLERRESPLLQSAAEEVSGPLQVVIPRGFVPWWQAAVLRPLQLGRGDMPIEIHSMIIDTLRHSARVREMSDNTIIAETAIVRSDAKFDVQAFMESKFVRTSVPTGSDLDAGFNVPRLREKDWFTSAGVRQSNRLGGRVEIAQRTGTRKSNSTFFVPANQGNTRLTLSYNQPLLNGAGKPYNISLIVLANLDTRIAAARTASQLQDHLLEVTKTIWDVYLQRAAFLQKQRHLVRAQQILHRLERRREIDSLASQIARARAAVAMRRTELIRAVTSIRNAESRLRALVNSPAMLANRRAELVPIQPPRPDHVPVAIEDALVAALENRPEIDAVAQEIEAARVRLNVATNELLPVLDLVLDTYVSGLRGNYDIGRSWADQFNMGEPSFTAGFVFEVPIHRRAAKAEHQRRRVQLRQLSSRFQATVETLTADVEIAAREVETTFREIQAKYTSLVAAEADARYLQRRWEMLPGDDRSASFLLEDLLDAQDRLAFEEFGFAKAQVRYTLSLTGLARATGTLLKHERVEVVRTCDNNLPTIRFEKRDGSSPPAAWSGHD